MELFDKIPEKINIKTLRLTLTDITKDDAEDYARLYLDDGLNKYWGYEYREDLKDNAPTPQYFLDFCNGLKLKKEEYSLAIRLNGKMIGEVVMHNFTTDSVEIGFRVFKEFQNKGYAAESVKALIDFIEQNIQPKKICGKCYLQNTKSEKLFVKSGFTRVKADETYYYLEKER